MVPLPPGSASILLVLGTAIALLGLAYAVLRVRRPPAGAGVIGVGLALAASAVLCTGTASAALAGTAPWALLLPLLVGAVSLASGLLILRRERRFAGYDPARSFGLLYIGVGALALVSALILPTLPQQFALRDPPPQTTLFPTATPSQAPTETLLPTLTFTTSAPPTLTRTPLPSLTPTPVPTEPPLPTSVIPTRSPTPSGPPPVVCRLRAEYNVNLRAGPGLDYRRLLTIPYTTEVDVTGKSRDGLWWRVFYEGQAGWVSAEFVTLDTTCKDAPVIEVP